MTFLASCLPWDVRFLILCLALFATLCAARDQPAPSAAKLFAWYDRLGFEDVTKAKFARIWTGEWSEVGVENQLQQDVSDGFILEDRGDTFRAVLADLSVSLLKKNGNDPRDREFCGYRELSLKDEAERLVKSLSNPRYLAELDDQLTEWAHFDQINKAAQFFVIARECERRGMCKLGIRLVRVLAEQPSSNLHYPWPTWLKQQLGRALYWRARVAIRDPQSSWNDVRVFFQRILEECPEILGKEHVETQLKEITSFLEEERTRKPAPPDSPEELVWRLHEEVGEWFESEWKGALYDYWPRPYGFEPRKPVGVRARLQALGKAAVPALLAELRREPRPTRSAYRYVAFAASIREEDTHDLALSILGRIAGMRFDSYAYADGWWQAVEEGREAEWRRQFEKPTDAPSQ